MTMYDLCRKVNCKYITWSTGEKDSCTVWLYCKLHKEITDENTCAKCKNRVPKRSDNSES